VAERINGFGWVEMQGFGYLTGVESSLWMFGNPGEWWPSPGVGCGLITPYVGGRLKENTFGKGDLF
jgi:hypothetical protein